MSSSSFADILEEASEKLANNGSAVGPIAGMLIHEIVKAAIEVMRRRNITTAQLVSELRNIEPLRMPWPRGARSDGDDK
jgi:hypothetical protein